MSGVRMLHILKDLWKFIQTHQYYTMALKTKSSPGLTLSRPLSHLCDGRSHSFRDHGRMFATKTKALFRPPVTFFVLSPLVLRVVSFERGNSAIPMTYDTVVGGIEISAKH